MVTTSKEKVRELINEKGGFDNFLKYYSSNTVTEEEKKELDKILFFDGYFSLLAALYYAS